MIKTKFEPGDVVTIKGEIESVTVDEDHIAKYTVEIPCRDGKIDRLYLFDKDMKREVSNEN